MSSDRPENTGGKTKPAWKRFEELVAEIQQKLAPGAKVTTNDAPLADRVDLISVSRFMSVRDTLA
jgi:hypothetical protein